MKELRIESNIPLILLSISIIVIVYVGYFELRKLSTRILSLEIKLINNDQRIERNNHLETVSTVDSESDSEFIISPDIDNKVYQEDTEEIQNDEYNQGYELNNGGDNIISSESETESTEDYIQEEETDSKEITFNQKKEGFSNKEIKVKQINNVFNEDIRNNYGNNIVEKDNELDKGTYY